MEIFIGVALALFIGLMARVVGLDRDRAFYPTVMIVIAFYYALFALMGGSLKALAEESVAIALFVGAAIAGFKGSLWLVAAALAAHGAYDLVHGRLFVTPGVPAFWPPFCSAYDVVAGGFLAWLLWRSKIRATEASSPCR